MTEQLFETDLNLSMLKGATRIDHTFAPRYQPPVLTFGGELFLRTGNLSLLAARPGLGKSRACAAIAACMVSRQKIFGFQSFLQDNENILWLDLERSEFLIKQSLGLIYRRLGWQTESVCITPPDAHPDEPKQFYDELIDKRKLAEVQKRLHIISLAKVETIEEKRVYVYKLLEYFGEHYNLGACILDGIGELVEDRNDEIKASEVTTRIRAKSEKHGFGVLSTLHLNTRDNKPQGHVGTKVLQQAHAVCAMVHAEEEGSTARKLTMNFEFKKNREGFSATEVYIDWSPDEHMFVEVDPGDLKPEPYEQTMYQRFEAVFDDIGKGAWHKAQAFRDAYMAVTAVSEPTAKRHIKQMLDFAAPFEEQGQGRAKEYRWVI